MKKNAFRTALVGTFLLCTLSVSAFAANEGGGLINASAVNFRPEPNLETEILQKLDINTPLIVIEKTDDLWYKVWNNGVEGYVYAQYLDFHQSLDIAIGEAQVSGNDVSFRSDASLDAQILGSYSSGKSLTVNGVNGEWYKVNIDGVDGFMHSDYIKLNTNSIETVETAQLEVTTASADIEIPTVTAAVPTAQNGQAIVDLAMSYIGVPYVWAGTSPNGFDCSGFVYYVHNQLGYKTNRTAESLAYNGVQVDRNSMQVGDIITFYNGSYSYVGHVGIYIGDNQFVHASSADGQVTVDSLTGYYSDRLHMVRRIAS